MLIKQRKVKHTLFVCLVLWHDNENHGKDSRQHRSSVLLLQEFTVDQSLQCENLAANAEPNKGVIN